MLLIDCIHSRTHFYILWTHLLGICWDFVKLVHLSDVSFKPGYIKSQNRDFKLVPFEQMRPYNESTVSNPMIIIEIWLRIIKKT